MLIPEIVKKKENLDAPKRYYYTEDMFVETGSWSYKIWYERCIINSKHPDWCPNCRINFLKKDPQWFIDNGYEKYVR